MKLRACLVAARKREGLTQAQLAKKLRVANGTVAGWETKSQYGHAPRRHHLKALARVLKLDYRELVEELFA